MIFVECTIVNLRTRMPGARYMKSFDLIDDFNKWYTIAKSDGDTIINVMRYNPVEKPSLKTIYDVKLLSVSREFAT